eukprot:TRINITY_DN63431_c0_g2_i1.p1 TRINITY_DN63431_c0_g2~~TRINITY_DN63431_c0_g2_i1.p1  ORF type:complete len:453 (-),score=24.34 TRINITY_DN63431_c0_g2_i1:124-1362(-)
MLSQLSNPRGVVPYVSGMYAVVFGVITIVMFFHEQKEPFWLAYLLFFVADAKSVMVGPMLWSVVNDVTPPAVSKKVYPSMALWTQLGVLCGSLAGAFVKHIGGSVTLVLMQVFAMIVIPRLISSACRMLDVANAIGQAEARQIDKGGRLAAKPRWRASIELDKSRAIELGQLKVRNNAVPVLPELVAARSEVSCLQKLRQDLYAIVEGLVLIVSKPYVFLVFWVTLSQFPVRRIVEYQGSVMTKSMFPDRADQIRFQSWFMVICAVTTAAVSLGGTGAILERFGLGKALFVLPATWQIGIILVGTFPNIWTVSGVLVVATAVLQGLNTPIRQMLYTRTSKAINFRAKSWSEMYGNYIFKVIGSQFNLWVNSESFQSTLSVSCSTVWISLWALAVGRLGYMFRQLEDTDEIVN